MLVVGFVIHCADISNVTKPYEISKKWADLVFEEFLRQGDMERERDMPISPYMDRNNTDQIRMTINFIGKHLNIL